mmetsp:Transcript_2308/g.6892  ORF Transcript_2308/g.6892 Transcript_2308/m.6892 type:complete len:204 (+) Transcript_2308:1609-2220(+)
MSWTVPVGSTSGNSRLRRAPVLPLFTLIVSVKRARMDACRAAAKSWELRCTSGCSDTRMDRRTWVGSDELAPRPRLSRSSRSDRGWPGLRGGEMLGELSCGPRGLSLGRHSSGRKLEGTRMESRDVNQSQLPCGGPSPSPWGPPHAESAESARDAAAQLEESSLKLDLGRAAATEVSRSCPGSPGTAASGSRGSGASNAATSC